MRMGERRSDDGEMEREGEGKVRGVRRRRLTAGSSPRLFIHSLDMRRRSINRGCHTRALFKCRHLVVRGLSEMNEGGSILRGLRGMKWMSLSDDGGDDAATVAIGPHGEPAHTNVTPGFTDCIDYVFVSGGVDVASAEPLPAIER